MKHKSQITDGGFLINALVKEHLNYDKSEDINEELTTFLDISKDFFKKNQYIFLDMLND